MRPIGLLGMALAVFLPATSLASKILDEIVSGPYEVAGTPTEIATKGRNCMATLLR